jgi:phage FluMu protein Com
MAKWGEIKCPRCEELEAERDALAEKLAAMEAKEGNSELTGMPDSCALTERIGR